jgi:hypothetical protein
MRKLLAVVAACLVVSITQADELRNICREDHNPPTGVPEGEKIGTIAGYEGFGQFIDDGGYGTPQSVLEDMEVLNDEYQENEYDPRQEEASSLYAWLNAVHGMDDGTGVITCSYCGIPHTMSEYESMRDAKIVRLNEISAEIDEEWCELVDAMRAMVSDSAYESYIDSF